MKINSKERKKETRGSQYKRSKGQRMDGKIQQQSLLQCLQIFYNSLTQSCMY